MLRKSIVTLLVASLLVFFTSVTSTYADSKNSKKDSNKGQVSKLISEWILPASKKSPTVIQAGRTLPIKFRLLENGATLQSTDQVTLSYTKLQGCEVNSAAISNALPTVIAPVPAAPASTPSPAATASASPSEDSKRDALQIEKGVISFNWKVPKTFETGCYKLMAKKGTTSISISSAVLRVRADR